MPPISLDARKILPDCYAGYAPAVNEAVEFFLERISPKRVAEIQRRVFALPPDTDDTIILVTIMRACPALHKIGQVLARHQRLDPEFRAELQALETCPPSLDAEAARQLIADELGEATVRYGVRVEEAPLAEGSVALVVPVTWKRPGINKREHGVAKILKPDAAHFLDEDLRLLEALTDHLDANRERYAIPAMEYRETLDTVRRLLAEEVHLEREQAHLRIAATAYESIPGVTVPALLPFCTPRLTAMERIDGVRVTDVDEKSKMRDRAVRHQIAERLLRTIVTSAVLNSDQKAWFHADPHAGNLIYTTGGKLAVIDWALIGELTKAEREWVVNIYLGAFALSRRRVAEAVGRLAHVNPKEAFVQRAVNRSLRDLRRGQLPGLRWLEGLLDEVAKNGGRFSSNLVLFRKTLFTLQGVIADVAPDFSVDWAFVRMALLQLASEWPWRFVALPFSRNFPTHVSNLDLARLYASLPLTVTRFWRGAIGDLADALFPPETATKRAS